jgi:PAS domain S-box-containing protein
LLADQKETGFLMSETTLDEYKQLIQEQGQALLDVIQSVSLGNLDVEVEVPEGIEILSDLAVGLETMIGDVRDTLAKLEEARAELERRVADRTRSLMAAAEVSRAAGSILDPDELIREAVGLLRERFDLYYAGVFLVDESGQWAVLRAGTGEAGQEMVEQGHRLEVGGESMIGWCVVNKETRVALDVGEETVRFDNPLLPETRSELALPLVSRGETIGALTIQSAREAAFSQEDIAALQTMADQLANAITNARLYEALAQEQYLMKALMDHVPDYIYFKDRQSRFIRTTKAHAKTFGLSDPAEAIGKTDFDFFSDEHARQAYEDEQEIVRTGEPLLNLEERETWPDRPDTWVLTSKMPLLDDEGRIVGTFGISTDITERKRAEEALRRRALQLQAAAEVAREAAAIRDVNQLLDEAVRLISDRFGFYHAAIFLVGGAREYVLLQAASSEGGRRLLERGFRLKVGEGIVGTAAETGEPRIVMDVATDTAFLFSSELLDTRSEMAVPLEVRGRVIGVLDVQSAEEGSFSEEDVATLQTLADQVALAIENARLLEEGERALRELRTLYGRQVRAAWREQTARRPAAYRYTRVGVEPAPLPTGLETETLQGQSDGEEDGRRLVAPISLYGQTIGSIFLRRDPGEDPWAPEEIALARDLADQISLALENARLLAETRLRAERDRLTADITARVRASMDVEAVLQTAVRELGAALGTDRAFIRLGGAQKSEPLDSEGSERLGGTGTAQAAYGSTDDGQDE